jgi:hypothetical protein
MQFSGERGKREGWGERRVERERGEREWGGREREREGREGERAQQLVHYTYNLQIC